MRAQAEEKVEHRAWLIVKNLVSTFNRHRFKSVAKICRDITPCVKVLSGKYSSNLMLNGYSFHAMCVLSNLHKMMKPSHILFVLFF